MNKIFSTKKKKKKKKKKRNYGFKITDSKSLNVSKLKFKLEV